MKRGSALIPVVALVVVVSLGGLLVTIGARSPRTHGNLKTGYDPSYVRTAQTVVGAPREVTPMLGAGAPAKDQVAVGRDLFYGSMCATCHGIDGQGGEFAPSIYGFNASTIADATHGGPGGMPVFDLTDAQIQAIAAYLNSVPDARTYSG